MKTKFYFNGEKITKKAAEEIFGKEKIKDRVKEAKEAFFEDPYQAIAWADGLEIVFE